MLENFSLQPFCLRTSDVSAEVVNAIRANDFVKTLKEHGYSASASTKIFVDRAALVDLAFVRAKVEAHDEFKTLELLTPQHSGHVHAYFTLASVMYLLVHLSYGDLPYAELAKAARVEVHQHASEAIKASSLLSQVLTVNDLHFEGRLNHSQHHYNMMKAEEGFGVVIPKQGAVTAEQVAAYLLASKHYNAKPLLNAAAKHYYSPKTAPVVLDEAEPDTTADLSFLD